MYLGNPDDKVELLCLDFPYVKELFEILILHLLQNKFVKAMKKMLSHLDFPDIKELLEIV